jgi:hypothetical protein
VTALKRLCSGSYLAHMPIPICWRCKHYRKDVSCAAFPKGIPAEILESEADHRQAYPGDHGIRFEPLPEKRASVERIAGGSRQ